MTQLKGNGLCMKRPDFEKGQNYEIPITGSFIKKALYLGNSSIMADKGTTLEDCVELGERFTEVTGREIDLRIFSQIPSNLDDLSSTSRLKLVFRIVVPAIGNKSSVSVPQLKLESYFSETENGEIYLPIFDMHTHPGGGYFPSREDLLSAEGKVRTLHLPDLDLNAAGNFRDINVIVPVTHSLDLLNGKEKEPLCFYQSQGKEGFGKTLDEYDDLLKEDKVKAAKRIEELGAFKMLFVARGKREGLNSGFRKADIEKIAKKFAYTATIRKCF